MSNLEAPRAGPENNKSPCIARATRRWKRQLSAVHAISTEAHAGRRKIKSAGVAGADIKT